MINYIALLVALTLSTVSAYYSIIGLTALFAGAFWPVVIMGSVLELGKVTTASWLYRNWKSPPLLKYLLTLIVILLMFITSLGIFGFLSRAHIEQQTTITSTSRIDIDQLKIKITQQQTMLDDVNKQIKAIDDAIANILSRNQAATALRLREQQERNRRPLVVQRDQIASQLQTLNLELVKKDSEIRKVEAEVGPLKYVATLIYGNDSTYSQTENVVRWLIILLVIVFDPLAVLLLIAANYGLTKHIIPVTMNNSKSEKHDTTSDDEYVMSTITHVPEKKNKGTIEVEKNSILNFTQ